MDEDVLSTTEYVSGRAGNSLPRSIKADGNRQPTCSALSHVDRMALVLDLQLNSEYRTGVIENFARIKAIAQLVNEFPLPNNIEAAPVFEP